MGDSTRNTSEAVDMSMSDCSQAVPPCPPMSSVYL